MAQELSVSLKINSDTSDAHGDVQQLGQAMEELGAASKTAEKALENEAAALKPLQADLERSAREAAKLAAAQKGLDRGQTDTVLQEKRNALLDAGTQSQDANNRAMRESGISAGQVEQAMRQLPAQLTDIFTSLAGGMPIWMVFTQQGGQIMDSFGGLSQMFTHLRPLFTAFRVGVLGAAVGVATLAKAYYAGSQEGDAYTKALVMSGNAAGTTTGQLAQMAANIDKVTGTQAQAAAALAQLAGTGVDVDNFQQFAQVAVQVEESLGQSVSETVKAFDELGKAPMTTTLKYNEALHYLTASVYEQIKALQEEGKTEEAGAVAQQAYAQALSARVAQMDASLGVFQRSWRSLGKAAAEAWDSLLGVGRAETPESRLQAATERVERLQRQQSNTRGPGRASQPEESAPRRGYLSVGKPLNELDAAKAELASLQAQDAQARKNAKAQADAAKAIEDRTAAEKTNAKWTEAALTPLEKMNKALKDYRENNEKITAGGAKLDPKQVAKEEAALKKSFSKGGSTPFQNANADAAVEMAKLKANLTLLQSAIKAGDAIILQALKEGNVTLDAAYEARLSQLQTDTAAQREALQAEMDEVDKALAKAKTASDGAPLKQKRIDIEAKLKLLDASLQEATRQLGLWKSDQEKQLANITAKVRIEVAGLTGQFDRSAVEAQIKAQYEGDYQRAGNLPEGEQGAARERIDMLVRAGVEQAAFNAKLAEAQRLQSQLAVQEEAVNTLATQGLISQTEADARLRQGRAAQVPQLQAIVQQLQAMRAAMPPDAAAAIDQISVSIGQLQNQAAAATPVVLDYGTKLKNTAIDGLADAAANAMTNFSNLRDMVGSTLKGMAADILRSGVKSALTSIFTPSGGKGGGGEILSSVVSFGKSLFGFAEGGHIRGPGTGTSDSIPALVDGTRPIAVSNNEFIQPEKAVQKYGLGFMEAVRTLRLPKPQFAFGGLVQAHQRARFATGGQVSGAGGGYAAAPNVSIQVVNSGTPQRVAEQSQQFVGKDLVVRVVLADLQSGGPISQGMRSARGR